jgi:hypothetical protein
MVKGTHEIIYSRQAGDYAKDKVYSNPRFFSTPRHDATKVYLVGDWPKIEAAYRAIGVPVEKLDEEQAMSQLDAPAPQPAPAATYESVEIPENWRDLQWTASDPEAMTLRSLANSVSAGGVVNKSQAVAAITAELARREAAKPVDDKPPVEVTAAVEQAPANPE